MKSASVVVILILVICGYFIYVAETQRNEALKALEESRKQIETVCTVYQSQYYAWQTSTGRSVPVFLACKADESKPGYFEVSIGTEQNPATGHIVGSIVRTDGTTTPWMEFDLGKALGK